MHGFEPCVNRFWVGQWGYGTKTLHGQCSGDIGIARGLHRMCQLRIGQYHLRGSRACAPVAEFVANRPVVDKLHTGSRY